MKPGQTVRNDLKMTERATKNSLSAKTKEATKAQQRPRKGHEDNGDAVTELQVAEQENETNIGK